MAMWTLDQGVALVRILQQPVREYGYHLAIGGGVVNKGSSEKDLDLYFLPMSGFGKKAPQNPDGLLGFLKDLFGPYENLAKAKKDDGGEYLYPDVDKIGYDRAVKFTNVKNDRRIDAFVFGFNY